jgi:hypothetical protein
VAGAALSRDLRVCGRLGGRLRRGGDTTARHQSESQSCRCCHTQSLHGAPPEGNPNQASSRHIVNERE